MESRSVQLCGPVSSRLRADAVAEFAEARAACLKAGAKYVWDPTVQVDASLTHERAMWLCLVHLVMQIEPSGGTLVVLPGWESSGGARLEVSVARAIGVEVVELSEVVACCEES